MCWAGLLDRRVGLPDSGGISRGSVRGPPPTNINKNLYVRQTLVDYTTCTVVLTIVVYSTTASHRSTQTTSNRSPPRTQPRATQATRRRGKERAVTRAVQATIRRSLSTVTTIRTRYFPTTRTTAHTRFTRQLQCCKGRF